MFKVLSQQLRDVLITVFERHLAVEDFRGMDQHNIRTDSFLSKYLEMEIDARA